jgi:hypothetical protein
VVKGYLTIFMPVGISIAAVCGCTEPQTVIQRIAPKGDIAGLITFSLINLQG